MPARFGRPFYTHNECYFRVLGGYKRTYSKLVRGEKNAMSTAHTEKKSISLLTHFRRYLVSVVGLLLILLLVRFLSENLLLSTWQSDATNALMLQQEVGTLQQSMLDQETGLRGYISTDDPLFLQPFTQGRQLYRMSLQHLKDHLSSLHFQDVQAALVHEDTRATIWYTTFALVQLQQVHR